MSSETEPGSIPPDIDRPAESPDDQRQIKKTELLSPAVLEGINQGIEEFLSRTHETINPSAPAPDRSQKLTEQHETSEVLRVLFCQLTIKNINEIAEVYRQNEVEDEAWAHLLNDEEAEFWRLLNRRGMLNRWVPHPKEFAEWKRRFNELNPPQEYVSVLEETEKDLSGQSGKPGIFEMCGLRDDKGQLIATLSTLRPPVDVLSREAYRNYNKARLSKVQKPPLSDEFMSFMDDPDTEEIDTINVIEGWRAAGTALLLKHWQRLKSMNALSVSAFYRRFGPLKAIEPRALRSKAGNHKSGRFFESLGFTEDSGRRLLPTDILIREIPHTLPQELVVLETPWMYGHGSVETAMELAEQKCDENGIIVQEDDDVIIFHRRSKKKNGNGGA